MQHAAHRPGRLSIGESGLAETAGLLPADPVAEVEGVASLTHRPAMSEA
jgi:hypothetical protein